MSDVAVVAEGGISALRVVPIDEKNVHFLDEPGPPTKGIHGLPGTYTLELVAPDDPGLLDVSPGKPVFSRTAMKSG